MYLSLHQAGRERCALTSPGRVRMLSLIILGPGRQMLLFVSFRRCSFVLAVVSRQMVSSNSFMTASRQMVWLSNFVLGQQTDGVSFVPAVARMQLMSSLNQVL